MVYEELVPPFGEWFLGAVLQWVLVLGAVGLLILGIGFVAALVLYGPAVAVRGTTRMLSNGLGDLLLMSPRRILAMTYLAVKESIRMRVIVVFILFGLILSFAGWFLDPESDNPAYLYQNVVLTLSSVLVLPLALLLSSFSLPIDLQRRTLHTVVTKPVRASEIIAGRILGFVLIGTVLLVVMGTVSFIFTVQGLRHTHVLLAENMEDAGDHRPGQPSGLVGRTELDDRHRHAVHVDPDGSARVESSKSHWHSITTEGTGANATYRLGSPEGAFLARVPVYGKLRFVDSRGLDGKGISVGDEWTYRSYIHGDSPAAGVWTIEGVDEGSFGDGLPVELTLGVFRTHKGNIEKGVLGSLALRNPDTGLRVEVNIFESKEFNTNQFFVPREITDFASSQMISRKFETPKGIQTLPPSETLDASLANRKAYDLFEDLVTEDGRVEVWIRCLDGAQYFGMAGPDLYLRAADAPYWFNFAKGYFGIWLQMVLVIAIGVMFSTFLSGPVAMFATAGALVGGFFRHLMAELGAGAAEGGGPFEAFRRLLGQDNLVSDLGEGVVPTAAQMLDVPTMFFLGVVARLLPSFGQFSYSSWVASGFNIPANVLLVQTVTVVGYLIPIFILAAFSLRNREVAR